MGDRGISWAKYKSAPRRREIPTPAPHHSIFYRPDALSATKPTASKQWRHTNRKSYVAYRMAPIAVTLSDPEGQFCCVKTISLPYLGKYSTYELQWIEQHVWLVISTVLIETEGLFKVTGSHLHLHSWASRLWPIMHFSLLISWSHLLIHLNWTVSVGRLIYKIILQSVQKSYYVCLLSKVAVEQKCTNCNCCCYNCYSLISVILSVLNYKQLRK